MRELKFRMFIKSLNEMVDNDKIKEACGGLIKAARIVTGIDGKGGLYLPTEDKDIVFMQYTGLKDKNGKEIYKGDIVFQHGSICVIESCIGGFDCRMVKGPHSGTTFVFSYLHSKSCEVIGNIYDNPELLEVSASELGKCCYKDCEDDATTEGVILARNSEGGKDFITPVKACDKHKNEPGFI